MHTGSQRRPCVIVGGGVTGCATAWFLARAGLEVVLIERDALAAHASGHNPGNLNPLDQTPPQLATLALAALGWHQIVREELSRLGCAGYELEPAERIHLGKGDAELDALERAAAGFADKPGFSARRLGMAALHGMEPGLAECFTGGVLLSGNLKVDSSALSYSLAQGAACLGAVVLRETVTGVVTRGSRVTAIRTQRATVPCEAAIFATGPWIVGLESWLGIDLAIEPVKGELLVLRIWEPPPRHDLFCGSAALYVRGRDRVLVGGTVARCGMDSTPTEAARTSLLEGAVRVMPRLRGAAVEDHWSALRPVAASVLPVAERAAGWENVYLANGGGSKGVLLSVAIGRRIGELLMGSDGGVARDPLRGNGEVGERYAALLS